METDKSLNKYISETGICSRREADKLIEAGRVTINGEVARKGNRVTESDVVCIDDKPLQAKQEAVYIAFNKPRGITCTTDLKDPSNVIDYLKFKERIFPIGRLDKDSEGLIFLTSDGDIVNKILRAGNRHEKEYIVQVNQPITPEFIHKMANGVPILDTITQKCKVEKIGDYDFRIILTQGLNRQIRRMTTALGYEVQRLRRTRIMNIQLQGIPLGKWRYFSEAEINEVNAMLAHSSKTEEASYLQEE